MKKYCLFLSVILLTASLSLAQEGVSAYPRATKAVGRSRGPVQATITPIGKEAAIEER
jgi:hypothetical protein